MTSTRKLATVLFLLGSVLAIPVCAQTMDQPECRLDQPLINVSINCPDMYAWRTFTQVVAPTDYDERATFQTWSSDPDTFQCPPADKATCDADPTAKGCPVWPSEPTARPSIFNQRTAGDPQALKRAAATLSGSTDTADEATETPSGQIPYCWQINGTFVEIVYRNRVTFDYIFQNGLWYIEGNQQAFLRRLHVNFPTGAIEVKTNWKPLASSDDPSRYYTTNIGGIEYGLVAMHLSTKALPNWFWSTFEHVDNPGRCDFLGCRDSFGYQPAFVPPHPGPECGPYEPGRPTPGMEKLLARLPEEWRYYRLKGSMTDFTTATGRPNLLGNSVTEAGFVQTASCMTCHSRATVGDAGNSPYPTAAGLTPDFQSYNGTPDPNWYYSNLNPGNVWSLQTDFVWAIPFKANSVTATAKCCAAQEAGSGGPCQN